MSEKETAAPRIVLIHAVREAIDPVRTAFAAAMPAAQIHDLLDTSLSADLAADGGKLGQAGGEGHGHGQVVVPVPVPLLDGETQEGALVTQAGPGRLPGPGFRGQAQDIAHG